MENMVQYQQSGNVKEGLRDEVFAWWKLEQAVLPLTILTDTLGAVQGLDRGEAHCTTDKNPNADEWQKTYLAPRRIEQEVGWRAQFVVTHVKAHATGESRRPMNDKETFNTEGRLTSETGSRFGHSEQSRMAGQ